MRKILLLLSFIFSVQLLGADQVVRLGDVTTHPGATLTVPLEVENLSGVASVHALVTYDPLVLVLTKVEEGTLKNAFDDFIASEGSGAVEIFTYGMTNNVSLSGTIANLTFKVREGSEGLYSDLTLAKVSIREKTMTADLTVARPLTVKSGMLRVVEGVGLEIECDAALSEADRDGVRNLLALGGDVGTLVVRGEQSVIELGIDLGIKPKTVVANGVATATFELPKLEIVDFDVEAGRIRARVTPPEGAEIAQRIVTGVIHVYGTDDLAKSMGRIKDLEVDLTDYLKAETKGEMSVTFLFGTKTFFKVAAGRTAAETIEATTKQEKE